MKKMILTLVGMSALGAMAQQVLNNAIVKAKIEVTTDANNAGGGDGAPMIQMAGNETDIKIFVKDSMRKVLTQNNFMNNIVLYDGKSGINTTLTESGGEKSGFTQTKEEREMQQKRMDSIRKARENGEGEGGPGRMVIRMGGAMEPVAIEYTEEAKEINKMKCKKAVVTSKKQDGSLVKTDVWYSPDFMLPSGLGFSRGSLNLAGLKGMAVMYETTNTINMGGNEMTMTTHFEVSSIEQNANIADKEFTVPKGYEVKTYQEYLKDNPDGMPGMRRVFRIGG